MDRQTDTATAHLGPVGGVGLVKEGPDLGLDALPAAQVACLVLLLQPELLHDVLLRGLVRVQVQAVQDGQHVLRVAVLRVRHPAARLHLAEHAAAGVRQVGEGCGDTWYRC